MSQHEYVMPNRNLSVGDDVESFVTGKRYDSKKFRFFIESYPFHFKKVVNAVEKMVEPVENDPEDFLECETQTNPEPIQEPVEQKESTSDPEPIQEPKKEDTGEQPVFTPHEDEEEAVANVDEIDPDVQDYLAAEDKAKFLDGLHYRKVRQIAEYLEVEFGSNNKETIKNILKTIEG